MSVVSFVLGILGNAIAILGLLSPMPTFWTIVKRKETGDFSSQPYLFSLLAAMFWTYYGILKEGGIFVVTISATSCGFQALYLFLFFCFASKAQRSCDLDTFLSFTCFVLQKKTASILLVILSSYVMIILTTMKLAHGERALVILGILSIIASVFSTAAPLSITRMVIKTRSVKYMPFSLSLCLFLNGACWLAYALSIKDTFMAIPNGIGVSLGAVQLALYSVFKLYGVQPKVSSETIDEITSKQSETLKEFDIRQVKNSTSRSKVAASDVASTLDPAVNEVLQEIKITN